MTALWLEDAASIMHYVGMAASELKYWMKTNVCVLNGLFFYLLLILGARLTFPLDSAGNFVLSQTDLQLWPQWW